MGKKSKQKHAQKVAAPQSAASSAVSGLVSASLNRPVAPKAADYAEQTQLAVEDIRKIGWLLLMVAIILGALTYLNLHHNGLQNLGKKVGSFTKLN